MAYSLQHKLGCMRRKAEGLISTMNYSTSQLEREVAKAELKQLVREVLVLRQLQETSHAQG